MPALALAVCGILLLYLGYRFYSRYIERIFQIDEKEKTPAVELKDSIDYIPAKSGILLFGHHFASIAGAGPIIGPVLACYFWGWLGVLIWLIVGAIFIGAVHDFSSLVMSLKFKGKSIGDISQSVLSKFAKFLFCGFLFLALILVIAVFTATAATTLVTTPQVVLPVFLLIPLAIFVGFLIYKSNINSILVTFVGIVLLFSFIILGCLFPIEVGNLKFWMIILLIYCFFASILPVNILLQPRDYLSMWILIIGLVIGYICFALKNPTMKAPFFTSFSTQGGFLFPMMCVVIACGAISGFHSLICSGTTSKQLPNYKLARPIGYGAMILETTVGLLAVFCVTAGLLWIKTSPTDICYPELIQKGEWIKAFALGYGNFTSIIFGSFGMFVGMLMLNAFILTTLDTTTRVARYICSEFFAELIKIKFLKNKYISTLFVVFLSALLAFGNWKAIWPVFGSANQLIAALVLLIATIYLLSRKLPPYVTFIPAVIMLIITLSALVLQIKDFIIKKSILLLIISSLLLLLCLFLIIESIRVFVSLKRRE